MRCNNRKPRITQCAAFTLIELLASMAILITIMLILISAFNSTSTITALNQRRVELNQTVRAVLEQISRDVQRAGKLSNVTNMVSGTRGFYVGSGVIPTNALVFLCDVQPPEPNPYGSLVSVGYQIVSTNVGNLKTANNIPIPKFALERGDDAGVLTTGPCASTWWHWWTLPNPCTTPTTVPYWKLFSDNVIGIDFRFYTNGVVSIPVSDDSNNTANYLLSWNSSDLPESVGVSLYTIDSRSYERALSLDPNLVSSVAASIITNSMQVYFTRIFIPRGTQTQ
jgi:type II secretory pathway pseudopilin PulG